MTRFLLVVALSLLAGCKTNSYCQIELKEDEDAMDTFNLARMDAEDERHRSNPFADEAELEDAGFEYVAEDEVNADFAGDDQED